MALDVYWLRRAEDKLEDIYYYYSLKAGEQIAQNLVNGIVDKTISIRNHPKIGQVELGLNHREEEFRYLVYKNYKILYWINYKEGRIEIANIFDTRQNPVKINLAN